MYSHRFLPALLRFVAIAGCATAQSIPAQAADPAPFDLPGPGLRMTVQRDGTSLPIGAVPTLSVGDTLTIRADLPEDQSERFLLISAFLRGATNPPPKEWIETAETWKRKDKDKILSLKVPKGAKQLVLFLVPDTGGASDAISNTVRARPGEFVRAAQGLNQASLDRSRLDAFMSAIQAQGNTHPEYLRTIAPTLARSLSIKLNDACLDRVIQLQASCLLENRESLVLADIHSGSIAETLSGAPTDLALQLSATREAGYGFYSPYIGVVRDVVRMFGAFSSPQFNYLPTISLRRNDTISLQLNAAPSFEKPKSVLVAGMPAVEADRPPQLRASQTEPICATHENPVLPVDGAALIYSTGFARNMMVKVSSATGQTVDLPVQSRASQGGYVMSGNRAALSRFNGPAKARLHGFWGFKRFDGPEFSLQFPMKEPPRIANGQPPLVIGHDNSMGLESLAPSCVESITLTQGQSLRLPIKWKASGDDAIAFDLPLRDAQAGELTLEVRQYGVAEPARIVVRAEQPVAPMGI